MAIRQRDWGNRIYQAILTVLGRRCTLCGSRQKLELDVINPTVDLESKHHRQWDISQRATFYRRQLVKDNLRVLCQKCNTKESDKQILLLEIALPKSKKSENPF
jgi:5-methylcytosine-specific restriction endonuclease McrA